MEVNDNSKLAIKNNYCMPSRSRSIVIWVHSADNVLDINSRILVHDRFEISKLNETLSNDHYIRLQKYLNFKINVLYCLLIIIY